MYWLPVNAFCVGGGMNGRCVTMTGRAVLGLGISSGIRQQTSG